MFDFLIVGSGLFAAVFAHEVTKAGKKCLVIEKRNHSGGNVYCETIEGINVHKYGPHIFHTDKKEIWDYVNSFVEFNNFIYSPLANYKDKLYNLPFNMNTFYQLWGVKTPDEALMKIEQQRNAYKHINVPQNLEEQALKMVGTDVFETLIKGYTEKQWGRPAHTLPAFIINRIPLRFNFNNNYFNHPYQGIPIGGYNLLINKLFAGVEVRLNTDYFKNRNYFDTLANHIVFTGRIDEFYNYRYGKLEYRSLHFESEHLHSANYQGVACVNYTDIETPFTRIVEHKHFEFGNQPTTIITREFPHEFSKDGEPYYPVNDLENTVILKRYNQMSSEDNKFIFGGRLAEYRYYDMHHVINNALRLAEKVLNAGYKHFY